MNPEILKRLNLLFQTPIDTKYSLETPLLLQKLLESPDRNYPLIHVAGTNGKGSVCWKLVNVLQNKGYKVGLYTQPHLSTFRERIQINGVYISEEEASYYLSILFQKIDTGCIHPCSFFELLTFLAFYYFAEKQVDIAVIETGLGGSFYRETLIVSVKVKGSLVSILCLSVFEIVS